MKHYLFLFFVCCFYFESNAQKSPCFQERGIVDTNRIFIKMEIYPSFKDGGGVLFYPSPKESDNKLKQSILSKLDFKKITDSIQTQFFTDTLNVKFVINKQNGMSDLIITSARFPILVREFREAIISSSCNWLSGQMEGRKVTGWYKKNIVFSLDGRGNSLSVKIEFI